ncbi:unnamed protein product, partial [Closterium sp. Naga37s-1]
MAHPADVLTLPKGPHSRPALDPSASTGADNSNGLQAPVINDKDKSASSAANGSGLTAADKVNIRSVGLTVDDDFINDDSDNEMAIDLVEEAGSGLHDAIPRKPRACGRGKCFAIVYHHQTVLIVPPLSCRLHSARRTPTLVAQPTPALTCDLREPALTARPHSKSHTRSSLIRARNVIRARRSSAPEISSAHLAHPRSSLIRSGPQSALVSHPDCPTIRARLSSAVVL